MGRQHLRDSKLLHVCAARHLRHLTRSHAPRLQMVPEALIQKDDRQCRMFSLRLLSRNHDGRHRLDRCVLRHHCGSDNRDQHFLSVPHGSPTYHRPQVIPACEVESGEIQPLLSYHRELVHHVPVCGAAATTTVSCDGGEHPTLFTTEYSTSTCLINPPTEILTKLITAQISSPTTH
jgi:hypothetical protein